MSNYEVTLIKLIPVPDESLQYLPIGKYGVITSCNNDDETEYLGLIVFRHPNGVFTTVCGKMWDSNYPKVKVRVLLPGESFVVNVKE